MDLYDALVLLSLLLKKKQKAEPLRKKDLREREIVWYNSEMTELGRRKKERKRGRRETEIYKEKSWEKWKQVSSLHLWGSHPSLTFYTEQTNSWTSSSLADGGQGVTGVRSQEAEEWADLKILRCLQDKGGSLGDGVAWWCSRIVPTLDIKSLFFPCKSLE